jgi:hypothetical protein
MYALENIRRLLVVIGLLTPSLLRTTLDQIQRRLYRFVYARSELSTQMKIREAVLACIFLANKAQIVVKWKRLVGKAYLES